MANHRAAFTQTELTRYAKAMQAAGVQEWRAVSHPDGRLEIKVGKGAETEGATGWEDLE